MNEQERKVKGTFLIALAMIINHRKDIDWAGQSELTEQDLKRIRERILASAWYELDLFERMGEAVYKLVGGARPEGAYEFGEGIMWRILSDVYKTSLLKGNPQEALTRFSQLYHGIFFNTGKAEFQPTDSGGIFTISDPYGIPTQESFGYMIKSLLARIVKENQGKNVQVICEQEDKFKTEKLKSISYRISWE